MRGKRDSKKQKRWYADQPQDGDKGEPRCVQCGEEVSPLEVLLSPVCGPCVRKNHRRVVDRGT